MHLSLAVLALAALTTLSTSARAETDLPLRPAPVAVLFEGGAPMIQEDAVRDAIARELARPVVAQADPSLATLTIAIDPDGTVRVRYRPPASEFERSLALPVEREQIPILVAVVAKNLASSETRDVMADLGAAKHASAPGPVGSSDARRFYLRLSLGGGYSAASYTALPKETTLSYVTRVGVSSNEVSVHAAAGSLSASGLAIGVEASGAFMSLDQHGALGATSLQFATPLTLGGFVDYYPSARGPLHLQGGVGIAYAPFSATVPKRSADTSSSAPVASYEIPDLFGVSTYLGLGYDFGSRGAGGVGVFARTSFGYFAGSDATYAPLGGRLGVSVAWL